MRVKRKHKSKVSNMFLCVVAGDIIYTDMRPWHPDSLLSNGLTGSGTYCIKSHRYVQGSPKCLYRVMVLPEPIGYMIGRCIWPIWDLMDVPVFKYKAVFHAR